MILLISPKDVYATKRLMQEAKLKKVKIQVFDVADLVARRFKINIYLFNVLYIRMPYLNGSPKYIPDIVKLAKRFKAAGKRVVDAVIAKGQLAEGKMVDYQRLKRNGLLVPNTPLFDDRQKVGYGKKYPVILKWNFGFKGRYTHFVTNEKEFKQIANRYLKNELLVQEFIPAEYEYKVITVGFKSLPVILRFKIDPKTHRPDFSKYDVIKYDVIPSARGKVIARNPLNIAFSIKIGKGIPHDVRDDTIRKVILLAQKSSRFLGRELAKVDILQKGKKFYILEVNRFPGLDSFEELTKCNVAKRFLEYLQKPLV